MIESEVEGADDKMTNMQSFEDRRQIRGIYSKHARPGSGINLLSHRRRQKNLLKGSNTDILEQRMEKG